jgi:DNA-directed RNA polymerase sigma subunit (sigma70/sigma32)
VNQPNLPDFNYDTVFASLTQTDRQYLFEAYGVPLDAKSIDPAFLQFLVTYRRIKQIEAAALSKLHKPPHTDIDDPPDR